MWLSRVVAVLIGTLLISAALLKLSGRDVAAIPPVGWLSTTWVQVAAAEWEIVLGVWLISGFVRHLAWWATLTTFATFAVVSGTLGYQGVASCGCFGAIQASPWWAFGLDIVALILLLIGRPRGAEPTTWPRGLMAATGYALLLLGLLASLGTATYGSPGAALARLRGETLFLNHDFIAFGDGQAGETLEATVLVRNLSARPVRLIGGTADCSCVTTTNLPLTLPAGGSQTVTIRLTLPAESGAFTRLGAALDRCRRSTHNLAAVRRSGPRLADGHSARPAEWCSPQ